MRKKGGKMKILVVEDNARYREAAQQQLAEHDLTIMKSFTEFFNACGGEWFGNNPTVNIGDFDIVLSDLHMPSPHDKKGEVEAATGFVVLLKALEAGVKKIAILTDGDHHEDTYSKALDLWLTREGKPFQVGEVSISLIGHYGTKPAVLPSLATVDWDTLKQAEKQGKKIEWVKDWKGLVDNLIKSSK
jgi:CheY-like chemotaxis protein